MKKILFSAVSLDIGGIEKALVTLLNYLAEIKVDNKDEYAYDITLVLEENSGAFLNFINKRINIIEYRPCDLRFVPLRKAINYFKQKKFKKEYQDQFDFSAAYATYSHPASFVARTASQNNALWVHSEYMGHFENDKSKYIDFFRSINSDKFKTIVFVSENAANIFKEMFKFDIDLVSKVKVINNLINYEEIIEKSKADIFDAQKEDVFTFLNVGRHTEIDKRLSRLINASKRLKDDGLRFRILLVGSGKDTQKYKDLVNLYDLNNELIFLGRKGNPYPYYKIADCFVLTSEYEGFPVVYNECLALNLPIITTDVSDSKTIISDKFGIITSKDEDSIYQAMKYVIKNGIDIKGYFDYRLYNKEIVKQIKNLI